MLLGPVLGLDISLTYAYMDDIILGHRDAVRLESPLTQVLTILREGGFTIAPNKIQKVYPFKGLRDHLTSNLDKVETSRYIQNSLDPLVQVSLQNQ